MRGAFVFGGPAACSVGVTALAFFFRVTFCFTVGEVPGGDGSGGKGGRGGGEARRSGDDAPPVVSVFEAAACPWAEVLAGLAVRGTPEFT